jgi:DNA processing protein
MAEQDLFTSAPLPVAPLGDAERLACLQLIRSENVGPVTFRRLINHFGGAQAALDALPALARRGGRRQLRILPRSEAERELDDARTIGATPLFTIEPGYPERLAHLDHPPPMIYAKGRINLLDKPAVAIVGSRNCSAAGHAFARRIADQLSEAGLVIVSGLARGIDGAAHTASLERGTVAVLAGGLDNIYPPEHADLHNEIASAGCLVSERPPGFKPRGQDFPRRNRIISGLAFGVVIVEAARRSGTLTTARFALEQGRSVYAVPGHPLDPRAEGTNRLIQKGATMVISADDVLDDLRPQLAPTSTPLAGGRPRRPRPAQPPPMADDVSDTDRASVVAALGPQPVHVDDLLRATGLAIPALQVALLELDLAGRLEHHGAQLVSLRLES